jgi:hypothetical protein
MSWKDDYIAQYGEEKYQQKLICAGKWRERNRDKIEAERAGRYRKGGKHYADIVAYFSKGLPRERKNVRSKHQSRWRPYKLIVAPESVLHHQWRRDSAGYDCVALVEKKQHQYGIIEVIKVLEGRVTLFTEKAIRERLN